VTYGAVLNGGMEHGNPRPGMVVHKIGARYLAFQVVGGPELWPRLLKVMERPELGSDARFATADARRENWRALREVIGRWLDDFASVDAAIDVLTKARLPCAPVLRPAEVIAAPHLAARKFFPALSHPARGDVRVTASPYHLDGKPVHPQGPAPHRVGQHTRDVLANLLGYDEERIAALLTSRAVEAP
jgi:formyl-CoA transferase